MRNLFATSFLFGALLAPTAMAQEDMSNAATIQITNKLASYSMNSTKVDTDGAKAVDTTSFNVVPTGEEQLEFSIFWDNYAVYVFPLKGGFPLTAGYILNDNLELGLNLSVSDMKVKDGQEQSSTTFGLYAFWLQPMGALTGEFLLNPLVTSGKATDKDDEGNDTESTMADTTIVVEALFSMNIAKNLDYAFGLEYAMSTTKMKETKDAEEVSTDSSTVTFNLAEFRYTIAG